MANNERSNYIKANIVLIQEQKKWNTETKEQREAGTIPFRNHTEVTKFLFDRLYNFTSDTDKKIINEWRNNNFQINKIKEIAIQNFVYHSHLKNKLSELLKMNLMRTFTSENIQVLSDKLIEMIEGSFSNDSGFKAIKTKLKKVLPNSLYFGLYGGFAKNLKNIKPGEDSTFFGQAAQFLFLARALRAGYNASNVDLPSSKYDAILDTGKEKTVKIQIKGFEGESISFFTRARGGQGIDSTDKTNQQVRITSKWCDFYVAVDHRVGSCFIIPMVDADKYSDDEAKTVKLASIQQYKEAWHLFDVEI